MDSNDQDSHFVNELTKAQSKMRAYVAKLLGNSPSTDDVLQECNKLLWVKREDWDPQTIFINGPTASVTFNPWRTAGIKRENSYSALN